MSNASVLLLEGSEGWLAIERNRLKSAAEEWVLIRADERTPGQLEQELRSYSFFSSKRTVLVERVDLFKADDLVELSQGLDHLAPDVAVILTSLPGKCDEAKALVTSHAFGSVKSEPKSGGSAARKQLKQAEVTLAPELSDLLLETFADNPLRLQQELAKLSLLAEGQTVSLELWRSLSSEPGVVDGWRFARAVMGRDLATADGVLRDWIDEGGGGHTAGRDLLGAVGYVLRQYMLYKLYLARKQSPSQAAKNTPGRFTAQDQQQANGWSLLQLGEALSQLVLLDRGLKSSPLPADVQLYGWCVAVTARQQAA